MLCTFLIIVFICYFAHILLVIIAPLWCAAQSEESNSLCVHFAPGHVDHHFMEVVDEMSVSYVFSMIKSCTEYVLLVFNLMK